MSCDDAERALNARLDGRDFDAAALEGHLATCPSCRAAAEDLDEMHALFDRARSEWRPGRSLQPSLSHPWRRWAAAAALLFLPLAGWAFAVSRPPQADIDMAPFVLNGTQPPPTDARDVLGSAFLMEEQP